MDAKELKNKPKENRFTSLNSLSEKEFNEGIKQAEEGSFLTVQESMTKFETWLEEKKKK